MGAKKINKQQIEVAVAIVSVIVFLVIILMPKEKPAAVYQQATESVGMVVGVLGAINKIQNDSFSVAPIDLGPLDKTVDRNPFDTLVQTSPVAPAQPVDAEPVVVEAEPEYPLPEIAVQGILYDARNPAASTVMIDGEEYSAGKVVQEWVLESVQQDQIVLKRGKQHHTIKMY